MTKTDTQQPQPLAPASSQGYTIDELRYQIALATLRKEFCREQLAEISQSLASVAPWSKKSAGTAATLTDAVFRGFKYSDYLILGISVFKTAKSIFTFFKRKKKDTGR